MKPRAFTAVELGVDLLEAAFVEQGLDALLGALSEVVAAVVADAEVFNQRLLIQTFAARRAPGPQTLGHVALLFAEFVDGTFLEESHNV